MFGRVPKKSDNTTYYEIIGVSKTASQEYLKKAYKKAVIKNHRTRAVIQRRFLSSQHLGHIPLQGNFYNPTFSIFSLSHSEPNIATAFWRQSRRKVIAEQRTASSSP